MKLVLTALLLLTAASAKTYSSYDEIYLLEDTRISYEDFISFVKIDTSYTWTRAELREALANYLQ